MSVSAIRFSNKDLSFLYTAVLSVAFIFGLQACGGGGASADPELSVTSSSPSDKAIDVDLRALLNVEFSSLLDVNTVNDRSLFVTGPNGNKEGTSIGSGKTATFSPAHGYEPLTQYTVTASTVIAGEGGEALPQDHEFSFTTRQAWLKQFGSQVSDYGQIITTDGTNLYVGGITTDNMFAGGTAPAGNSIFIASYTEEGDLSWFDYIPTTSNGVMTTAIIHYNGSIYISGYVMGSTDGGIDNGAWDSFVTKYTDLGVREWTTQFGTSADDIPVDIAISSSGELVVVGYTDGDLNGGTNQGNSDGYVAYYNTADGTHINTTLMGTVADDYIYAIDFDAAGNYYLGVNSAGDFNGLSNNLALSMSVFVVGLDKTHTIRYTTQLIGSGIEYVLGLEATATGVVYVTGYADGEIEGLPSVNQNDLFVSKITPNGTKEWIRKITDSTQPNVNNYGYDLHVDNAENIYVIGSMISDINDESVAINHGSEDVVVAKYSPDGTRQWARLIGTPELDRPSLSSVTVLNENIYFAGSTDGEFYPGAAHGETVNSDAFIGVLNPDGSYR